MFDLTYKTHCPQAALDFYQSLCRAGVQLDAIAYATLFQALSQDRTCAKASLDVFYSLSDQMKAEDAVYTSVIQYILPVLRKAQPDSTADDELLKILKNIPDIPRGLVKACIYYGLKTLTAAKPTPDSPDTTSNPTSAPANTPSLTPTASLIEKIYWTYKQGEQVEEGWFEVELDTLMLKYCVHTHNLALAHTIFSPYVTHQHIYVPLYVSMLAVCTEAQDWLGGVEVVRRLCDGGYLEGLARGVRVGGRTWGGGEVSPLVEVVRFIQASRSHGELDAVRDDLDRYEEQCLHGIFSYMSSIPLSNTHNRPAAPPARALSLDLLLPHLPFIHRHNYQNTLVEYCKHCKDRGVSAFWPEVFRTLFVSVREAGDQALVMREMQVYYEMIRCIPSMIQTVHMLHIQAYMLLSVDDGEGLEASVCCLVGEVKSRSKDVVLKELVQIVKQEGGSEKLLDCILLTVRDVLGVSIRKEDVK